MSTINCPHCETRIKIRDSQIGRRLPCPGCSNAFTIPAPGSAVKSESSRSTESIEEDEFVGEDDELFAAEEASDPYFSDSPGLPARKKKKKKSASRKKQAEQANSYSLTTVLENLPVSPVILAAGVGLMFCGVVSGLLIWSLTSGDDDHPDQPTIAATDADEGPIPPNVADAAPRNRGADGTEDHDAVDSGHDAENPTGKPGDKVARADPKNAVVKRADPPIPRPKRSPAEMISFLKAATVFVKVDLTEGGQSGSGFLLESNGGSGIVITNAHVIDPEAGRLKSIDCVFRSGSREEFTVRATVLGKDTVADLAVLQVRHDKLPPALDPPREVQLYETLPVLVLGFPFGEALNTANNRNPAITVSRGTVSSIRRDDYEQLAVLQIDGGINQGNSGGPVVTEDGTLLGVSVAKVRGTEIGLAIPQRILSQTLRGRVVGVRMATVNRRNNGIIYESTVDLIDPRHNIRSARMLVCPADRANGKKPDEDGLWARIAPDMKSTALKMSGNTAKANVEVPVSASGSVFQIAWTLKDGTELLTAPIDLRKAAASRVSAVNSGLDQIIELPTEQGDTRVLTLPSSMSDFAMNLSSGDVAAVDPEDNKAFLYSAAVLAGDEKLDEVPDLMVGDTPVSIVYKRYQDKEYFAVVGTQDSNLYMIDAQDFTLIKRIPVTGSGLSAVVSSQNPLDPFLYYNYGSGHGSAAGAVDVRTMADLGQAFDDSMDCAISADGKIAYRRGPWSPSGFESLLMVTPFEADRPSFVQLFYDHHSTPAYVPDPFGQLTASGKNIYTRGLDKQVGALNFQPAAFFSSRPVIIGLEGLELRAASYNTLSSVGVAVRLPNAMGGMAKPLPRGVGGQADFKRVGEKARIFADDSNRRVVFGFRNKLALVPLKIFQLPSQPFMTLDIDHSQLTVGKNENIKIAPRDNRVQVEFGELPLGAVRTEDGLEWTPEDAQVGTVSVPVTVTFEDIERRGSMLFSVTQPSISAPFQVAGFSVSEDTEKLVCWSGPGMDRYGRPLRINNEQEITEYFIGVVDVNARTPSQRAKLPFAIRQAILIGTTIAALPVSENSRVELYDAKTLKREKTLLSTEPLTSISSKDGQLLLHGQRNVDVYDMKNYKRVRTLGGSERTPDNARVEGVTGFRDGIIVDGVLFDPTGNRPMLVVSPDRLPTLSGADTKLYTGSFLRRHPQQATQRIPSYRSGNGIVAGPVQIAERHISVSLERTDIQEQLANRGRRIKRGLWLVVNSSTGGRLARIPLFNTTIPDKSPVIAASLKVSDSTVYAVYGSRIFKWSIDRLNGQPDEKDNAKAFYIVPQQSSFEVRSGRTELKHTVKGGNGPMEYVLLTRLNGVTINERSGVVTLNSGELLEEAIVPLLRLTSTRVASSADAEKRLQAVALNLLAPAIKRLGRKPRGFPVAVPIHLKVVDNGGQITELQYFVVMEVAYRTAAARIFARSRELQNN